MFQLRIFNLIALILFLIPAFMAPLYVGGFAIFACIRV